MPIEVRTPDQRFVTRAEGRTTWHAFSFGAHYDPGNTGFGPLVALNDEVLPPGTGYPEHAHTGVEIVTWVIEGALRHTDSSGHDTVLAAGQVQRLSAGSGIRHSETNTAGGTTRFVQSWLQPDDPDRSPDHVVAEPAQVIEDTWTCLAGPAALPLDVDGASLWLADIRGTGSAVLPDAPRLHLLVLGGAVTLGDDEMPAGATARLTDSGGRVDAHAPGAQLLVWALP